MTMAHLAEIALPDFGLPSEQPVVQAATYAARLGDARERSRAAGHDALIVYADREHSANIASLTGFEPRFEEAMLIIGTRDDPALVVGNECQGYAAVSQVPVRTVLYQNFSLMGQDRGTGPPLADILADEGIGAGSCVGVIGWKVYDEPGVAAPETWIDAPSYLVDALRKLTADPSRVVNATGLLTNARDGIRIINDVDQLAVFEFAACHTSTAVRDVLFGLEPGMSEFDAVRLMKLNGLPLSCHLMLSSGERAWMGLGSPSAKIIARGDAFTTAFGLWGALNCRAGWVVADASELSEEIRDYVERLVVPYFTAIAEWYETIGIGVTGGALYDAIRRHIGDPFFGIYLNPGHQIHLDEWVNSPVFAGSDVVLRSGMALQVDVIPATATAYFTTNIEDGIALADETLRAEFARRYPQAWGRIQARRDFMADALGITLRPEVLPFSNIPAYLPPFLLRPTRVMTKKAAA